MNITPVNNKSQSHSQPQFGLKGVKFSTFGLKNFQKLIPAEEFEKIESKLLAKKPSVGEDVFMNITSSIEEILGSSETIRIFGKDHKLPNKSREVLKLSAKVRGFFSSKKSVTLVPQECEKSAYLSEKLLGCVDSLLKQIDEERTLIAQKTEAKAKKKAYEKKLLSLAEPKGGKVEPPSSWAQMHEDSQLSLKCNRHG